MYLGAHIGTSDGLAEAVRAGKAIGCEAIQIFSKSPQMWKGTPISEESASGFRSAVTAEHLMATSIHHSYLINLASPKPSLLQQSRRAFVEELGRAEQLGVDHLIFHPGAHTDSTVAEGLARIVESLNWAAAETPGYKVRALLENAAGQGTTLCRTLEELAQVLNGLHERPRFGVTLDTCHLFASGYDLRTDTGYGEFADRAEATLGKGTIQAFHLNDSKSEFGSRIDRHENIGKGTIGREGFRHVLNDPRWKAVPGYLETPLDEDDYAAYARDLRTLRTLLGGSGRRTGGRRR